MPKLQPGGPKPSPDAEIQARMSDSDIDCRNPNQDMGFLA